MCIYIYTYSCVFKRGFYLLGFKEHRNTGMDQHPDAQDTHPTHPNERIPSGLNLVVISRLEGLGTTYQAESLGSRFIIGLYGPVKGYPNHRTL